MSSKIEKAFEQAKNEIAGLKAISVVEIESGLFHGALTVDDKFDLEAASAYNAEVLKAKIRAKNAMGLQKEKIDLIIIELSNQIHLIQPTPKENYLVYMAADKSSNLGITRRVIKEVGAQVQTALN